MESTHGHRQALTASTALVHRHFQQPNGRWVAELQIEVFDGGRLTAIQGLEPRDDLDFATEAEAVARNRTLALNWLHHH